MSTAGFVSQVHPGVEETSHGEQLLEVEEVGVLERLAEDPVPEIWGWGGGERMQGWAPAPNPGAPSRAAGPQGHRAEVGSDLVQGSLGKEGPG